jgi:hypothetical protein
MHNLFFGGMSQYYYQGATLVQDNTVPFVSTISRVSRNANGDLYEYKLPIEMPNLKGAGAEFIPNKTLPHYSNEVVQLSNITANEVVIGHLFGGIQSSSTSAFTDNQTGLTAADPTVYEVKLVRNTTLDIPHLDGKNPFSVVISPNPTSTDTISVQFTMPYTTSVGYFISTIDGKVVEEGDIEDLQVGVTSMNFNISSANTELVFITFVFDDKYYRTEKVIKSYKQ